MSENKESKKLEEEKVISKDGNSGTDSEMERWFQQPLIGGERRDSCPSDTDEMNEYFGVKTKEDKDKETKASKEQEEEEDVIIEEKKKENMSESEKQELKAEAEEREWWDSIAKNLGKPDDDD